MRYIPFVPLGAIGLAAALVISAAQAEPASGAFVASPIVLAAAGTPAPCVSSPLGTVSSGSMTAPVGAMTAPPAASLPTMPPALPTAPPSTAYLTDPSVQGDIASGYAAAGYPSPNPACGGPTILPPGGSGPLVGFSPAVAAAIESAAAQYGLSPCLLGAVAMQESSGNPNAIGHDPNGSTVGYGLFQITVGSQPFNSQWADPTVNADKGATMVAAALAQYPNMNQALTYYNCGNGCGNPPNPAYTTKTNGLTYPASVLANEAKVCPSGQQGAILWNMLRKMVGFTPQLANQKWVRE